VPSGEFILSSSASAPSGYTYSGMQVTPDHRWSPKAAMPTARGDLAAAANNKIYAIGGISTSNSRLTTVEEYDVATNRPAGLRVPNPATTCPRSCVGVRES
jgi:hypothetical protein